MNRPYELHLGDALAFMATLPDESVDHVITDPPYEVEAHTLQRRIENGALVDARLGFAPLTEEIRNAAAHEFARVTRRWALVFCQAEAVAAWRDALTSAGLVYRRACVWIKRDGQPQLSGDRPGQGHESIVVAHAPGKSRWNGGGKLGLYDYSKGHEGGRASLHPTEKPLRLMEALVADFTDPGDLVLDPFAGSGTTGVAALKNGRRFMGSELSPEYHAVALKRLQAAHAQPRLLEVTP